MKKCVAFVALAGCLIYCHESLAKKKKIFVPKPKAILVQLKCEENRIHHFETRGNAGLLRQVRIDAEAIRRVTVRDFKDNFSFCPVYFFMDSNFYPVIEQKLNGSLLHADGTKASREEIAALDTSYLIVNYNTPYKIEDKAEWGRDSVAMTIIGDGLVIYDRHYQQLDRPFRYFIGTSGNFLIELNIITLNPVYNYGSRRFEMEYYAVAEKFEKSLIRYYERFAP